MEEGEINHFKSIRPTLTISTLTFSVKIDHEMLEYVHVCRMRYGAGGGSIAFAVNVGDGLSANVEHQRVHQ